MPDVYRFSLLPEERILLVANATIGAGIIGGVLVVISRLLEGSGVGLGGAFGEFAAMRGVFAALCGVYAMGLLWSLLLWRRSVGTTLRFVDDRLIFTQPGWFGGSGLNVELSVSEIRRIVLRRVRPMMSTHVDLRGDGVALLVPIFRCVDASGRRQGVPRPSAGLVHELVQRLAAASGVSPEVA